MNTLPFSISRRSNGVFYVRFKNPSTGKYLTAQSTGQKERKRALAKAWELYNSGMSNNGKGCKSSIASQALKQEIRQSEFTPEIVDYFLAEAKRKGILSSYVLKGSKSDIPAYDYMLDFWDWDKSDYIAEKRRKEHSITKFYCQSMRGHIKNHWKDILNGKTLGELTKTDLLEFVNVYVSTKAFAPQTKNCIIRAGTIALKFAYNREIIDKDITGGIIFFSGKSKPREILTKELAQAVFSIDWHDNRAKLANMLAMVTGMRAGEIAALKLKDLGRGCIYVNHSWNIKEGLKSPKNGETRVVQMPFAQIMDALLSLGNSNPWGQGLDGFVFYSLVLPDRPVDEKLFIKELRIALQKAGLTAESSKRYTFHAWRHFYTAYMRFSKGMNDKLLMSQTGHKSLEMLEHYAAHELGGEAEIVRDDQKINFGGIVEKAGAVGVTPWTLAADEFLELRAGCATLREIASRILDKYPGATWSQVKDVFEVKEGTFCTFRKMWREEKTGR